MNDELVSLSKNLNRKKDGMSLMSARYKREGSKMKDRLIDCCTKTLHFELDITTTEKLRRHQQQPNSPNHMPILQNGL